MKLLEINHWSTIINIILQKYFSDLTTTCILWHKNFSFNLRSPSNASNVFLHISTLNLNESFAKDVYDFKVREKYHSKNGVHYNDLIKKLVAAIENTYCEGFLAFQDDIPIFAAAFRKASSYAIWRSINNRFLFVYSKDCQMEDYFQEQLFKDQPNILIITADFMSSSLFSLKTNKFVGPKHEHPEQLVYLNKFNALNQSFYPDIDLFSENKLLNLQGREIILGAFDYRPFIAVDFKRLPLNYDLAEDNPTHLVHADGTEVRICYTFCELFNCTIQFDTTEKEEWGMVFPNYTGNGVLGMLAEGKVHMAMGGIYMWQNVYERIDMSTYLGRSGVTCLVPAPLPLISWNLPLRPFQFTLWLAVFGYLVMETVSLLLGKYLESYFERNPCSWWYSLQFGFATTFKIFLNQISQLKVNSHTLRTMLFFTYMFDVIITSIYGGGLASILTLPTFEEAADSVDRLHKYNLTWSATSYDWIEFINIKESEDLKYKQLISNFKILSLAEMREMAKSENKGFVLERLAFGHFGNSGFITPDSIKRLKLMVDDLYDVLTVFMVPRLWAHLPKLNDLILSWHSSGLDKFWEWKITAEYLNVNEQNRIEMSRYTSLDRGAVKLNMNNFGGLILLWLVGMGLSILSFIGELLMHNFKRETAKKFKNKIAAKNIEIIKKFKKNNKN